MQYDQSLNCLVREVVIADPALGLVYVLNTDISDVFYRMRLQPMNAHKLVLVSTLDGIREYMVSIPLTLSMVWNNSLPILRSSAETVAELAKKFLHCNQLYHKR